MKKDSLKPQKIFVEEIEKKKLKELKNKFGKNKKLPRGYSLQALIALQFYPELADVKIEFRFKETNTILSTKPTNITLPLAPHERTYLITISKKAKAEMEAVTIKNLSFNMQIGVIAHELAHVADFLKKNSLQVLKEGALYGFKPFQRKLEKHTDLLTIKHGLVYQLLDFAVYVNKIAPKYPDEKYYKEYNSVYMSPTEIEAKISALKIYK